MSRSLLNTACGVQDSVVVVLLALVTVETEVTVEVVAFWEVVIVLPGTVDVDTMLVMVVSFGSEVFVIVMVPVCVVVMILSSCDEVSVV